jgi:23S rRNA (guanosine2251-2'-O)-methyltransferase
MSEKHTWIIGIHAVTEALKQRPDAVVELVVQAGRSDQRLQAVRELAQAAGVPVAELSKQELDKQVHGVHQGIAALSARAGAVGDEKQLGTLLDGLDHDPLLLILDSITDPHNLGACLRTADAAGVDAVIIPKDKSAPVNETVRKVACGAAETVTIIAVTNLARCMQSLQERGIWIVGTADETAKSLYELELTGPLALVMGAEGTGLRRLTREHCDFLAALPMAGAVSSLNVSVATGICLFEAVRQRAVSR